MHLNVFKLLRCVCVFQLLAVVSELERRGLAILVLGRKHMLRPSRSWERHNMDLIQQKAHCFFTENMWAPDAKIHRKYMKHYFYIIFSSTSTFCFQGRVYLWVYLTNFGPCVFQLGGWPLLAVCHFAFWEPLSVRESGPDEGPQGLPARRSHQTALLQMAERPPDGSGWLCSRRQENPISGEEEEAEEGSGSKKEAYRLTVCLLCVFRIFPATTPLSRLLWTRGTFPTMTQTTGAPMKYHNDGSASPKTAEQTKLWLTLWL